MVQREQMVIAATSKKDKHPYGSYLQKDCKRKFRPVIKNKQMLIG